ncbi:MAG: SPOR domain-containing protein [Xanthomonadales bacterium]|nr:SPOR domain-containing protein [Xanthomonadales bacterium]
MASRRRTAGNRRKASSGIPAWFLLLGGILIGLAIAGFLVFKGYLPQVTQHVPAPASDTAKATDEALLGDDNEPGGKTEKQRFDFFRVLPEMEVVIPEQELSRRAEPLADTGVGDTLESFVLQAGSFRNAADAEQMKARLALLGSIATIHTVTVNGETWHRVRIGPFEGARKADEMRRLLDDNNIDTLILKATP